MRHISRSVHDRQNSSAMLKALRCTCFEKFPPLSLPSFLICWDVSQLLFPSFPFFSHYWLKCTFFAPLCLHPASHHLILSSFSIHDLLLPLCCALPPCLRKFDCWVGLLVWVFPTFSYSFHIWNLRLIVVLIFLQFLCSSSLSLLNVLYFFCHASTRLSPPQYPLRVLPPLGSMGFGPWLSGQTGCQVVLLQLFNSLCGSVGVECGCCFEVTKCEKMVGSVLLLWRIVWYGAASPLLWTWRTQRRSGHGWYLGR